MAYVARSGTWQRFVYNRDIILGNQGDFATSSTRLNTGQRLLNNYETLNGSRDLIEVTGKLTEAISRGTNTILATTELELAESSINNIKDILDQLKDDALLGSNDTSNDSDRKVLGGQLRILGENLYQVANAKVGKKFLFGGTQSDIPVITHQAGGIFSNASYKEGNQDLAERQTEKIQSSVSLSRLFTTESNSAVYSGSTPSSLPLASNAEMNLLIHDGTKNINVGDISFSAGDDLNTIVSKINVAFNAAGGQGSVAQNDSGRLKFDTALITGNKKNSSAAVVISKGSNLPNTLSSLGLSVSSSNGVSANIRETLSKLDEAYNSNDSEALRALIVDLDENLNRIVAAKAQLGDLVSKFNAVIEKNSELKMDFQIQQSDIAKIPVVEAIQEVNKAQAILQATMKSSANIISQNVFDFLRI
jgi:flagellin-like hook-associated protein FlgL